MPAEARPFSGAVLVGGASSRMGADKPFLAVATRPPSGRPLAAVTRDALVGAGAAEVLAVGATGERAERLGALGLRPVADAEPGEGPLGGLLSALDHAAHDPVVVLACDLPGVTAGTVRALLDALERAAPGRPGVIAVAGGRAQPLLGAWHPVAAAPPLRAAFAGGERSLVRAVATVDPVRVAVPAAWARNVNTPGELWGRPPAEHDGGSVSDQHDGSTIPAIDVHDLARLREQGEFLLDVRQPDEYDEAHVPGAYLIPLDQLGERAGEVPSDRPIYVICRSGGRSGVAVDALRRAGYDATNVAGGTLAWIDAGLPVATGPEPG